ncbi:MAG: tyrosine--tRNA ligase [Bacilli bacterium]|nr:tyrosine--tRNA ligase [Bacilli bacterium]
MKLYDELIKRDMIKDVSNEELAKSLLNDKKITFYCGFDPSAQSLQIGNFVQVVRMMLLQKYGHKPIILVGGATGLIGDPKQSGERKLLSLDKSLENAQKIKNQLSRFIDFSSEDKAILVDNYDWISKIDTISFLRDYGKYFNINYMLAKDTIASRLDSGISYTEFSYMLIQSIDFLKLYEKYDCQLQFGGSDQWGNITAGLELIRKVKGDNSEVIGISSPLLVKSDGTKFGKSESGALWLDEKMTSPYQIYQHLINTADEDVVKFLKNLTLLDIEEIEKLENNITDEIKEGRVLQKLLAKEVVTLLHGDEAYKRSLKITETLFSGKVQELSLNELEECFNGVTSSKLDNNMSILDILVNSNILSSKREAREMINNGAITVNGEKITDENKVYNKDNAMFNKYLIIRKGKKTYNLVELV